MSAINANIIVEPITLSVTDTSITQTVTVEPINLGVFTAAPASNPPGLPNASLQYNNGNIFGGLANATVSGGTLTFTNLANLSIAGGSPGYQLATDGAGVLSWTAPTTDPTKIINGTSNVEISTPNGNAEVTISSINVTNFHTGGVEFTGLVDVTGNIETSGEFIGDGNSIQWNDAGNVKINGGTNGYVLQTDGLGTLSWVAQGGAGTGNPGGSSTQVQYNDAGLFGGDTSFTFDSTTKLVTVENLLVNNTTTIQQAQEKVDLNATPATGTINFNLLDQAIVLQTADATGNFTLNFRGNATTTLDSVMSTSQSMTCTYINENGAVPYYLQGAEIDGVTTTVEYYGGVAPSIGSPNEKDYYTFNIIKTGSATFTLLASYGNIG